MSEKFFYDQVVNLAEYIFDQDSEREDFLECNQNNPLITMENHRHIYARACIALYGMGYDIPNLGPDVIKEISNERD